MARQIKRFLQSELKHVSKWTYALILVIYACMVVLQLNSFPMWFCSLRENSFLGFFPDPTLLLSAEDVLLFGNAEVFRGLLFNVAPLAHALFFPFIAACIVPRFVVRALSRNRGGCRRLGEGSVCALSLREWCCLLLPFWARLSCRVSFCTVLTARSFWMLNSISTCMYFAIDLFLLPLPALHTWFLA